MLLPGFTHRPGVHCGSTALADALAVAGHPLSEAMAFGLGAGLGFYYLETPGLSPSHWFQGRQATLEQTAARHLGLPAVERTAETPDAAWDGLRDALRRGIAPIVETELSELPYWNTRTRFGGHRILVAGVDEARGVALVADTERPGLAELPRETLERARVALAPPFGRPGRPWLEIAPGPARPLPEALRDALKQQARDMLLDPDGLAGVSALERFAAALPGWPARAGGEADRAWCFRFASQVIEKRGTGGGLFRLLYAAFLREAEALVPGLGALGLSGRMAELAAGWTRLSAGLREVADVPGAPVPPALAGAARALAAAERRYHEDVAARIP